MSINNDNGTSPQKTNWLAVFSVLIPLILALLGGFYTLAIEDKIDAVKEDIELLRRENLRLRDRLDMVYGIDRSSIAER